ncbi:hypothetical protein [Epilithonimonas vandammei]|uniref:hypothetical protein n=1 Tax=Epilithonimonas vandammei TaxID=2487072 RepID=UPI0028A5937C|nr:hypothetical protein [Epilithonimonas vandammei]
MSLKEKIQYTIKWIIIFIVSISMIVYGVTKPIQFSDFSNSTNVNVSEGHKIMWNFYSYSLTYPLIIGFFEILGGISLLSNRSRIFGCILLTIILSNIIIQDYIYEIVALKSAIFYQILVLILFLFDKEKLKKVLTTLFITTKFSKNLILIIIALIIALLVKYFETRIL